MLEIRRAAPADVHELSRLWALLQADNAMLDSRLLASTEGQERFRAYIVDAMDHPQTACFAACAPGGQENPGRLAGFILGQIHQRPTLALGDCGYITDLFVDSEHRLQGAGRALYVAMRDWYHANGITTIEVQIVRASSASQVFWRKMGFTDFLRTLRNDGGG